MDSEIEPGKEKTVAVDQPGECLTDKESAELSTRRRFAKNAFAGGAVLLSLSNRSAWGALPDNVGECMSWGAFHSISPNRGMAMFPSAYTEEQIEVARDIQYLLDQGELGNLPTRPEGYYLVQDPDAPNGVCIAQVQRASNAESQDRGRSQWEMRDWTREPEQTNDPFSPESTESPGSSFRDEFMRRNSP